MMARCYDPTHHKYHLYGARGIIVFAAWHDYSIFRMCMGNRTKKFTIDRIDNNGNYEPGNCKWSTLTEQNRNKRTTRRFEHEGKMYTAAELHESFPSAVGLSALIQRLTMHGWNVKEALTLPEHSINSKALANIKIKKREHSKKYQYNGIEYTNTELSELPECVVDRITLHKRLSRGWTIEKAMKIHNLPNDKSRRKNAQKERLT